MIRQSLYRHLIVFPARLFVVFERLFKPRSYASTVVEFSYMMIDIACIVDDFLYDIYTEIDAQRLTQAKVIELPKQIRWLVLKTERCLNI